MIELKTRHPGSAPPPTGGHGVGALQDHGAGEGGGRPPAPAAGVPAEGGRGVPVPAADQPAEGPGSGSGEEGDTIWFVWFVGAAAAVASLTACPPPPPREQISELSVDAESRQKELQSAQREKNSLEQQLTELVRRKDALDACRVCENSGVHFSPLLRFQRLKLEAAEEEGGRTARTTRG